MVNMRAWFGVLASTTGVLVLSGCTSDTTLTERDAAKGIAIQTDRIGTAFSDVDLGEPGHELSPAALGDIATYYWTESEDQTTQDARRGTVVYAIDSDPDMASISIFVTTTATHHSAFEDQLTTFYGCGQMIREYPGRVTELIDTACPGWLSEWDSTDGREVSLAGVTLEELGVESW